MVEMVEYDLDLTAEETKTLCEFALERICKDEKALTNYAILSMLGDIVENLKDITNPKELKKIIKNVKKLDKEEKGDIVVTNDTPKKRGRPKKVI